MIDRVNDVAPNFKGSILHRQIIGPKQMQDEWGLIGGNIFHGELTVDQLFHMRPGARLRGLPHADRGALSGEQRHPCRRRRDGMPGHHCVREILKDKRARKRRR